MRCVLCIALSAFCIGFLLILDADLAIYFVDIYRQTFVSNPFKNDTIWIIGASSGIGECLAYDLSHNNASKLILSARRTDELKRVQSTIGSAAVIKPLDLFNFLDEEYAASFVTDLFSKYPDINIVVLNSALSQSAQALDTTLRTTMKLFEINVFSLISVTKAVINHGLQDKNKSFQIVITSSLAALGFGHNATSYASTKSALDGYFHSLQLELVNTNIDFTIIYPGPVRMRMDSNPIALLGANMEEIPRKHHIEIASKTLSMISCSRCAELYSSAIYSKFRSVWIAPQPVLLFSYITAYGSIIIKPLQRLIAPFFL